MESIGIITYHSAYNYGSVLQAYATQAAVKKLGFDSEIINYRMKEQRKVYALYRTSFGIKCFIKDIMQIPVHQKRKQRKDKFEYFINNKLCLSNVCSTPGDVTKIWDKYPLIVSGSDQIWNKHSLELEHNDIEFMNPYLLKGYAGKKVSYASSIANMTDSELDMITPEISRFDALSMRESESAARVGDILKKKIEHVVDPTFLLNKDEWIDSMGLKKIEDNKYILYYSLDGIQTIKNDTAVLREIAKSKGLKVKVVTPFVYLNLNDDVVEMNPEIGPEEFLELIYNAYSVVTDSYHGTILSVNFEKNVFSICKKGGSEFRKTDILSRIGMEGRIIYDANDIRDEFDAIDYTMVNNCVESMRKNSLHYLEKALCDE